MCKVAYQQTYRTYFHFSCPFEKNKLISILNDNSVMVCSMIHAKQFFSVFLINKNKNAYKTNNKQRENEIDMQHEMILIKGKTVCVI